MPPFTFIVAAGATKTEVIARGLTMADWIKAGAVVVAGIVAAQLLRRALLRRLHADEFEHQAIVVSGRFARLVVVGGAIFFALSLLGIQLGPLIGAIGIGGIAIALAAQSMLADLIASILLQTRRPFRRGDQIETNDHHGRVEDVNFRTVVLRSYDGQRVFLPASKVLNAPIVNYSALGRRRTRLTIGLSYDADLEDAAARLIEAVRAVEGVHSRPAAEVNVTEFGESSMNVDVIYWHAPDQATTRRLRSAVAIAAKRVLDDAGIDIPFPQRVLRFTDASAPVQDGRRLDGAS